MGFVALYGLQTDQKSNYYHDVITVVGITRADSGFFARITRAVSGRYGLFFFIIEKKTKQREVDETSSNP